MTHFSLAKNNTENKTFWEEALNNKLFQSMRVHLQGFHLTEWLPTAPGRYFTLEAERSRFSARHEYQSFLEEYSPKGKYEMIFGGIGSIRLSAKHINSKDLYFLGASSTGISHQGIPIALFEPEYHQVMWIIQKYGGCFANLIGTLKILPTSLSPLLYSRGIPKFYLNASKLIMRHAPVTG